MNMLTVYLNAKKLCTAGIEGNGVLGAHVSSVRRKDEHQEQISLHVGGLQTHTGEHLIWHEALPLKLGDEVRVVLGGSMKADAPAVRKRPDAAADERAQKKFVREMARKFGWKIVVPK